MSSIAREIVRDPSPWQLGSAIASAAFWAVAIRVLAIATIWLVLSLPWLGLWYGLADLEGWPLNDDPFYAKPLEIWASEGRLQPVRQYGELTASSLAHVSLGGLATAGNGLRYRGLYLVCIAQQALGAAAIYWLAVRLRLPRRAGVLAALCLVGYPLYFGHAFTFMTDGPATAWAAIACCTLTVGFIERQSRWLVLGAVAVAIGYWMRQTNGLLLLAPWMAWLVSRARRDDRVSRKLPSSGQPSNGRSTLMFSLAGASFVACLPCGVLESGWLTPSSLSRAADIAPQVDDGYWKRVVIGGYGWLLLAGWFALPMLPWLVVAAGRQWTRMAMAERRWCTASAMMVALCGAVPLLATQGRAHITNATGAFIQNGHFGPIFLSDMDEPGRWGELAGIAWPAWVWQCLSVLSVISAGALGWWSAWLAWQAWNVQPGKQAEHHPPAVLLSMAMGWLPMIAIAVLAIALFVQPHMDRYWLFLMPAMLVCGLLVAAMLPAPQLRRGNKRVLGAATAWTGLCLLLNFGLSVVYTHDMLAWNHARWQYVQQHLAAGHAAETIDGGRDVNAWLRLNEDPDSFARPGDRSRWWSGRAVTAISSGPRPGWRVQSHLPFTAWATGRTHHLLVLRKE